MKKCQPDISAPIEAFIEQLTSDQSKRAYRSDWDRYVKWLEGEFEGAKPVGVLQARPRHIQRHVAWLHQNYEKSTASRGLSVIRAIYGALVLDELMPTNPAREVKVKRVPYTPKAPVLDEAQVQKLLRVYSPPRTWKERRDSLVLHALFGLGWRRSEIAAMRVEDIEGGVIHTVVKGGKPQTFRMPEWLREMIAEWVRYAGLGDEGPLFPRSQDRPASISDDIVYTIVRDATIAAGMRVSPHALRRTNITLSGLRGVSLKDRQLAVGHSSQATTERYDKANDASKVAPGDVFRDLVSREEDDEEQSK